MGSQFFSKEAIESFDDRDSGLEVEEGNVFKNACTWLQASQFSHIGQGWVASGILHYCKPQNHAFLWHMAHYIELNYFFFVAILTKNIPPQRDNLFLST